MTPDPYITVIMAVYNAASTVEQALASFSEQTYQRKELIVIDGGSTDGSLDVIRTFDSSIAYFESKPDRGIYHAWNKALAHGTGDWIHFLGADDYFPQPHVLEQIARSLTTVDRDIRIVYGRLGLVSSAGTLMEIQGDAWTRTQPAFLSAMCLPHQASFHHRSLFSEHGPFDESFRIAGDYEFLLRELTYHDALFLPNIVVKEVKCFGVSSSWLMGPAVVAEIARAKRKHGLAGYDADLIPLWLRAVVKYMLARSLGPRLTASIVDRYRQLTGRPSLWTAP